MGKRKRVICYRLADLPIAWGTYVTTTWLPKGQLYWQHLPLQSRG